jgi:hypothetical protein
MYHVPDRGKYTHPDLEGDEATYLANKSAIQLAVLIFMRKFVARAGEYFLFAQDRGQTLRQFLRFLSRETSRVHLEEVKAVELALIEKV